MTTTDLPAWLVGGLNTLLQGTPRAPLMAAASSLSETYRRSGHSDQVISDPTAALAYAVTRMPATYAATVRVLAELRARRPTFAPRTLLDLGAGPGTASFAAISAFPSITSATLLEPNPQFRTIAKHLAASGPVPLSITAGDARSATTGQAPADLVILSYVLAEHDLATTQVIVTHALESTGDCIVLIEPGTPHGFARQRHARDLIIASGYKTLAPCPHDRACPLIAPDWCHFTARLARRRDHRLIKGADAPYEDEPFSYVIASRQQEQVHPSARLLRPPHVTKGDVSLALCTAEGLAQRSIPRRNKAGYKTARDLQAGDTVDQDLVLPKPL